MSNILEDIKEYCKGKSIIIVGNSSNILNKNQGNFIDSHDIVVRINYAIPIRRNLKNDTGIKTNIYIAGISKSKRVLKLIENIKLDYILRLSPYGEKIVQSNVYQDSIKNYNQVKQEFNAYKPSSGCLAINFFCKHINFKSLTLIGFDFFNNSSRPNIFKSYLYKDHDPMYEKKYIISKLNNKVKLIKN